ncbi:hypothetical protein ACFL5O_04650 [Myxococcota bacterium]
MISAAGQQASQRLASLRQDSKRGPEAAFGRLLALVDVLRTSAAPPSAGDAIGMLVFAHT